MAEEELIERLKKPDTSMVQGEEAVEAEEVEAAEITGTTTTIVHNVKFVAS
ncbi:hypothetical protein PIB30_039695 [Stylosanthes scabra]|uniref:Uncharacterized protein n=1 Tax=Stylosanthes scabra TaxID=79078 RepID=A0ABU6XD73_9FABA|nr:hypothetical protein [Stylosanthes scabra]